MVGEQADVGIDLSTHARATHRGHSYPTYSLSSWGTKESPSSEMHVSHQRGYLADVGKESLSSYNGKSFV